MSQSASSARARRAKRACARQGRSATSSRRRGPPSSAAARSASIPKRHRGAIDGRGRTVAVLPCGLDYPYLMDNANLRREILDSGGALVTEYPMQTPVAARRVPDAQPADFRHGARRACGRGAEKERRADHGAVRRRAEREVFVFIGEDTAAFAGCIGLAADGAARIRTAEDILRAFSAQRKSARTRAAAAGGRKCGAPRPARARRPAVRFRGGGCGGGGNARRSAAGSGAFRGCAARCWRRSAESRSTPPFWRRKPGFPQAACSRR